MAEGEYIGLKRGFSDKEKDYKSLYEELKEHVRSMLRHSERVSESNWTEADSETARAYYNRLLRLVDYRKEEKVQ